MSRKQSQKKPSKTGQGRQKLRIIGGQWRSRQLEFIDIPGLRPTTERMRETLFNWLQPYIPGARCLDIFAGSGALGIEALSREASSVTFIDANSQVTRQIQQHLNTLDAANAECIHTDALQWLQKNTVEPVDIIFLDPPFRQSLLAESCDHINKRGWIRPGGLVYIEAEKELQPLPIPANWLLLKEKTAGQLISYLFRVAESTVEQE